MVARSSDLQRVHGSLYNRSIDVVSTKAVGDGLGKNAKSKMLSFSAQNPC